MELSVFKRAGAKKSENKQLRNRKDIPGVIYDVEKPGENIYVKGDDFHAILRSIKAGGLSTTIFTLKKEDGTTVSAIVKELQHHRTKYNILHVDFEVLHDKKLVDLNIPIECTGKMECMGVKEGGVLRQIIRSVKVRCLPKDIPQEFYLDVKELVIGAALKLHDIKLPSNVSPRAKMQEVVVTVSKR